MGYYTTHRFISAEGPGTEAKEDSQWEEEISLASEYQTSRIFDYDVKWYHFESDIKKFSKKYPEHLFWLEGTGEDPEDHWQVYVKNGKIQWCHAKIIFPPFDETKLT